MSKVAYIGYSTTSVARFEDYLPEPHAPSNYKDELKIREYITAAREKQYMTASDMPLTGVLKDIAILTRSGQTLVPVEVTPGTTIAEQLSLFPILCAFDASLFARLLRVDEITQSGSISPELSWLVVRDRECEFFDPLSSLLGAGDHDPFLVAKRFLGENEHTYSEKYIGVAGKARLTAELARLLGV